MVAGVLRLNNKAGNIEASYPIAEVLPIIVNVDTLNFEFNKKDSLIYSIAVLSTKICPYCVSNTIEFINESKEDVERFVRLADIPLQVDLVKSDDIDPWIL
mgnify:CR=1 FL=1